jgi:galactose mutarotase-like enzyme
MQYALHQADYSIVIDETGAELISLKKSGIEFLWDKQKPYWQRQAPVLFPIIGKLKNNKYTYKGKEYSLPQHGFARDMAFDLVAQSANHLEFKLENRVENYPFDYELKIAYTLDDSGLLTSYKVKNNDEVPMPFSIGAHPAFRCPHSADETLEDYCVEFPDDEYIISDSLQDGLRTGRMKKITLDNNRLWLSEELFKDDALVLSGLKSKAITLKGKSHQVSMDTGTAEWLGIWKQPGAPFVCLEPWWGVADRVDADGDIFRKEGVRVIEAGEVWEGWFRLTLKV